MTYTNETVSAKVLHAAKQSLGELINGTAEIVGAFNYLRQVASEMEMPLDDQIMSDVEQMFITINRLLYEQESKLKHRQMMQLAERKGIEHLRRQKNLLLQGDPLPAQDPSLFNHAI